MEQLGSGINVFTELKRVIRTWSDIGAEI